MTYVEAAYVERMRKELDLERQRYQGMLSNIQVVGRDPNGDDHILEVLKVVRDIDRLLIIVRR
jgi:hypothetical protein